MGLLCNVISAECFDTDVLTRTKVVIKLFSVMCIAGIGDDEDLALYDDAEEPQIVPASQSPAPVESPVTQPQTAQQQSQLIAQLQSPPQIPLQVIKKCIFHMSASIQYTDKYGPSVLIPCFI
jgi:hypothetical protein